MTSAKELMRSIVKKKLHDLPQSYIDESNRIIEEKFLASAEYKEATRIFAYYSVGREVSTHGIIRRALCDGKRVALPLCRGNGIMEFREISDIEHLTEGKYGIPEPDETSCIMECEDGDLVLVPCLCCDAYGNRLGRGAGYYDRFLGSKNLLSICLCYSKLMDGCIPMEPHDRRIGTVISEN